MIHTSTPEMCDFYLYTSNTKTKYKKKIPLRLSKS